MQVKSRNNLRIGGGGKGGGLGRGEDNPPGIKDPQIMMGGKTASYIGKF